MLPESVRAVLRRAKKLPVNKAADWPLAVRGADYGGDVPLASVCLSCGHQWLASADNFLAEEPCCEECGGAGQWMFDCGNECPNCGDVRWGRLPIVRASGAFCSLACSYQAEWAEELERRGATA
jgi:hypothetical protein